MGSLTTYNFIDYEALIELYGSFEKVLVSLDSNAGAEYEIKDDCGDHSCYQKMLRMLYSVCNTTKINVEKISDNSKKYFSDIYISKLGVKKENIEKFFHLPRSS